WTSLARRAKIHWITSGTMPNGQPMLHAHIYRDPAGPGMECGEWQQALEIATHLDLRVEGTEMIPFASKVQHPHHRPEARHRNAAVQRLPALWLRARRVPARHQTGSSATTASSRSNARTGVDGSYFLDWPEA